MPGLLAACCVLPSSFPLAENWMPLQFRALHFSPRNEPRDREGGKEKGRGGLFLRVYRARNKGLQILLSNSQAGTGRKVKQEQEETSRNHVQAF